MKTKRFPGPINASICVFFIVSGLFITSRPVFAFPSTILENFDTYTPGIELSGQGNWISGDPYIAVSEDFLSKTAIASSSFTYSGDPAQLNIATTSKFYLKANLYFTPWDIHTGGNGLGIFGNSNIFDSRFYGNADIINMVGTISTGQICSIPTGNWFKFEAIADITDTGNYWIRYNCNSAGWGEKTKIGLVAYPGDRYFKTFYFSQPINGYLGGDTSRYYIDDLEMNPSICPAWKNREDCASAGCFWEDIIFHQEYSYCRDIKPEDGPEMLCENSAFNCVYCNSSSTCSTAGCFWNNIQGCSYTENSCQFETLENCDNQSDCQNASGTWSGDFCFSSAVKENCLSMDLLPKLVCQIKNFLGSMFLPSKAKLTDLKQTIDTINTKFPSNYLKATYSFFGDIRDGIVGSAGIPFKLMGHEQNINFSVLERSSSTIGGVNLSFGGIIKLLTGFGLLIPFISWTLNFLQRIFK